MLACVRVQVCAGVYALVLAWVHACARARAHRVYACTSRNHPSTHRMRGYVLASLREVASYVMYLFYTHPAFGLLCKSALIVHQILDQSNGKCLPGWTWVEVGWSE